MGFANNLIPASMIREGNEICSQCGQSKVRHTGYMDEYFSPSVTDHNFTKEKESD